MIRKLLCWLGWHEWEDVTHPAWKDEYTKYRCKHCHKCKYKFVNIVER